MTPDEIRAVLQEGKMWADRGNRHAAIACWTKVLPFQRGNYTLYAGIGNAYLDLHKWDQAVSHYRVAVQMRPDYIPAIIGYADALSLAGRPDKALVHLQKHRKAFKKDTEDWGWYLGAKGTAMKGTGNYNEAERLYSQALQLAPKHASLWNAAANLMYLNGDMTSAGLCYEKAYQLDANPMTSNNLSAFYLATERWADAWRIHEERLLKPDSPVGVPCKPWWNGQRFTGRLAVFTEQGHGDFIMFARYLEPLKWKVSDVTLVVAQPQKVLADAMNLGVRVTDNIGKDEFDVQCALMSLPHLLEIPDPRQAPPPPPIVVPPTNHERTPAVCLVWAGNPENPNAATRNLPLRLFAPLVRGRPDLYWFTTMTDKGVAEDIKRLGLPIHHLTGDWGETASRVAGCDLMIAVETGVTHLAGTLGIPCWTLVGSFCDWRWNESLGPSWTPWYRNMELFRQERGQSWESVLKRVGGRLMQALPQP